MYSYTSISPLSTPPVSSNSSLLTAAAFQQPTTPAATFQSAASLYPTPLFRQASTSSTSSRYDAYHHQPSPPVLSTSSLEQPVYRGVFHAAEPTMFAPTMNQQQWHPYEMTHAQDYYQQQQQQQQAPRVKKLNDLTLPSLTYSTPTFATAYTHPSPPPTIELPHVPSHVERYTSFYSSAIPSVILKSIRIGFQSLTDMHVEFEELTTEGKFRAEAYTADHESLQFIVRIYKTSMGAPAPYLVEFQRRSGDAVAYFRLYQKMVKYCSQIHQSPYESSFLGGLTLSVSPLPLPLPSTCPNTLAPPSLMNCKSASLELDLPCLTNLCNMMQSDCIESKRESAKVLANVSVSSDLFPPTLQRQQSSPSALAASKAIWDAVESVLTSGDVECTRIGCSLLRNCLARGDAPMLLEHLETSRRAPSTIAHLVTRLSEPSNHIEQREMKHQVAGVLQLLTQKKGAAWINSLCPNATQVLNSYNTQH